MATTITTNIHVEESTQIVCDDCTDGKSVAFVTVDIKDHDSGNGVFIFFDDICEIERLRDAVNEAHAIMARVRDMPENNVTAIR